MGDQRRLRAVFIGDSITDAGYSSGVEPDLGAGYVRMIRDRDRDLGSRLDVSNAGVSGDRVVDLRARWSCDVVASRPDVLTVLVGINDTWRRYDSDDPTSSAEFARGYEEILGSATAAGVGRILVATPFLVPVAPDQRRWRSEDLDEKIAVVVELAERFGSPLIPLHSVFDAAAAEVGATALAEDGVHPTPRGHALIAEAWWRAFEVSTSPFPD
ncbi:SGNH/GDSL hydrolase family protein [Leifsonia shinshuensis]|uniref:SGNH/GDSL hydrolase family protein n=1 Tax=Leifsonia shinshuensis TaxID=150026 RepID=UPI001F50F81E|nr:SGNH/GDSL hydrolase family protein [Leifsonia shinshuensis]MCI0157762.1 SGNH/GDSL hydrolase family protein [Leifsonia shinshuensis]